MKDSRAEVVATNISTAGLGNRVRFTLSALSLAQAHGRDFKYSWPQTDAFRPPFTSLWEFAATEISWSEAVSLAEKYPYVKKVEDLPPASGALEVWHFQSGEALALPAGVRTWVDRFRDLVPTTEIQERVRDFHSMYLSGGPYVGISIRAHEKSHAKTLEASPVDWYLARMRQLLDVTPELNFFLSCDVPEVQERIIQEFPTAVGQVDKGEYNSAEGVVSSVVDLYLLAASSYLLVPYWSTFPVLAWELGGRSTIMEHSRSHLKNSDAVLIPAAANPLRPGERPQSGVGDA